MSAHSETHGRSPSSSVHEADSADLDSLTGVLMVAYVETYAIPMKWSSESMVSSDASALPSRDLFASSLRRAL